MLNGEVFVTGALRAGIGQRSPERLLVSGRAHASLLARRPRRQGGAAQRIPRGTLAARGAGGRGGSCGRGPRVHLESGARRYRIQAEGAVPSLCNNAGAMPRGDTRCCWHESGGLGMPYSKTQLVPYQA